MAFNNTSTQNRYRWPGRTLLKLINTNRAKKPIHTTIGQLLENWNETKIINLLINKELSSFGWMLFAGYRTGPGYNQELYFKANTLLINVLAFLIWATCVKCDKKCDTFDGE